MKTTKYVLQEEEKLTMHQEKCDINGIFMHHLSLNVLSYFVLGTSLDSRSTFIHYLRQKNTSLSLQLKITQRYRLFSSVVPLLLRDPDLSYVEGYKNMKMFFHRAPIVKVVETKFW